MIRQPGIKIIVAISRSIQANTNSSSRKVKFHNRHHDQLIQLWAWRLKDKKGAHSVQMISRSITLKKKRNFVVMPRKSIEGVFGARFSDISEALLNHR